MHLQLPFSRAAYDISTWLNGLPDSPRGLLIALRRASESSAEKSAVADGPASVQLLADEPVSSISPGDSSSGVIGTSGDVDYFNISLVAGQTYTISLRGTGDTPLADSFLTLSNSGGTIVASDDDGGQAYNSLLTFTPMATGTYQIAAAAYPDSGLTGGYTVDVRQMGTDSVGSTIGTATPISLGSTTFGFVERSRDADMYAVTLTEGTFYSIELAGGADYDTNPNSVPSGELDTRVTIYDASGNQIAFNDDITFPDDVSSALTFSPSATGTYYIKVDAYNRQTGGYTLDVNEIDLSTLDPLDSIDWGTQLPSNTVTVYFAPAGQTFDGVTSLGWSQYEIDQAMAAFQTWADVSNLTFTITNTAAGATFKLVTTNSNQFLGYFNPPGTTNAGVGVFAVNGTGWNTTGGLEPGGYGWITLVHEFGHGLGLAHPHDNGGTSTIMPGVISPFDSYGIFDLNQGVYTTMSYNDGWQLHPGGATASLNYGWQGGPGAFDIALIQLKYGASSPNTGDNVYVLPTANAAGTFWDVIWDTGGIDTIAHTGTVSARIDLTAATLDYSPTGAGVISYVDGIFGGFTIAAGVVIENATGGSGADVLIGNQADNVLDGGAGDDTLQGNGGTDTFLFAAGDGQDTVTDLTAGETVEITGYTSAQSVTQDGTDVVVLLSAGDRITFQNTTVATVQAALQFNGGMTITGTEFNDTLNGTSDDDAIYGLGGDDTINGLAGNDLIDGGYGNDTIDGGDGNDTIYGGGGVDYIHGGDGDDLIYAGPTDNHIFPEYVWDGPGNDTVYGGEGQDFFYGSPGSDYYDGGTGGIQPFEGDQVIYSDALAGIYVDMSLTSGQVRSLDPGDAANVGVDTLVNIEAVGGSSFDDVMYGSNGWDVLGGNDGNDTIDGRGGDDNLNGGNGDDSITGGTGNDQLVGGDGTDTFKFATGDGMDTVTDLTAGETVEILGHTSARSVTQDGTSVVVVLSGSDWITFQNTTVAVVQAALQFPDAPPSGPTEGDDTLTGTSGDDTINGLGGNDTIDGLAGNDSLEGGAGDDMLDGGAGVDTASYESATGGVVVSLQLSGAQAVGGGAGTDTLANIENLTGSAYRDTLSGNGLSNVLTGLAGSDTLNGRGGADIMIGGVGNDTYIVDDAGDVTVELAGEGNDRVKASVSYVLGDNIENLILTGSSAIDGTGNALNNKINGNSAANTLVGLGGNDKLDGRGGADTMIGGTGNDTYAVRDAGDVVIEAAGEGTDLVNSWISYTLTDNVENLSLAGNAAIDGAGNDLANVLKGNSGANTLSGLSGDDVLYGNGGNDILDGGAGADLMYGGSGDDIFYVDHANDIARELAGEGIDTVYASVTAVLRPNVENLVLIGTAAINGRGNELGNAITGNSGANSLYGMAGDDFLYGNEGDDSLEGGAGADTMAGGAGTDLFVFRDGDFGGLTPSTADTITDFSQAEGDQLRLDFVDANTLSDGNQHFQFIGTDGFNNVAGELRYEIVSGNTHVYGDTNGDGIADLMVMLDGTHGLAEGDFII